MIPGAPSPPDRSPIRRVDVTRQPGGAWVRVIVLYDAPHLCDRCTAVLDYGRSISGEVVEKACVVRTSARQLNLDFCDLPSVVREFSREAAVYQLTPSLARWPSPAQGREEKSLPGFTPLRPPIPTLGMPDTPAPGIEAYTIGIHSSASGHPSGPTACVVLAYSVPFPLNDPSVPFPLNDPSVRGPYARKAFSATLTYRPGGQDVVELTCEVRAGVIAVGSRFDALPGLVRDLGRTLARDRLKEPLGSVEA